MEITNGFFGISSYRIMSQHTTITIEVVPPHNGKPITKIAISPQSRYVVTYSQEDKSFVGWCNNYNYVGNDNDELAIIYDMKNKQEIHLNSSLKNDKRKNRKRNKY
ncbi:uncharacterized protein OCT59_022743 [Rhizophagus irregularis]|uniref:uncharacterized protein n=1 Tax=Rhizophagus irregularis TaxID=588596 RepID=UPI003330288E|nr:hypothetical protein OCT59_022743 [Rhizophagus irregularis]